MRFVAESSDNTWAGEEDFVLVEATESGSAECSPSSASSGSEAASRPQSLALQPPATNQPPSNANQNVPQQDTAALQLRVSIKLISTVQCRLEK